MYFGSGITGALLVRVLGLELGDFPLAVDPSLVVVPTSPYLCVCFEIESFVAIYTAMMICGGSFHPQNNLLVSFVFVELRSKSNCHIQLQNRLKLNDHCFFYFLKSALLLDCLQMIRCEMLCTLGEH